MILDSKIDPKHTKNAKCSYLDDSVISSGCWYLHPLVRTEIVPGVDHTTTDQFNFRGLEFGFDLDCSQQGFLDRADQGFALTGSGVGCQQMAFLNEHTVRSWHSHSLIYLYIFELPRSKESQASEVSVVWVTFVIMVEAESVEVLIFELGNDVPAYKLFGR